MLQTRLFFVQLLTLLNHLSDEIRFNLATDEEIYPEKEARAILLASKRLKAHLEKLGLKVSARAAARIIHEIELHLTPRSQTLQSFIEDLNGRIQDELASVLFFSLSADKAHFYESSQFLFGEQVRNHFPSATYDIDEAGKCFALGRYTACVFHLMRALEVCLRLLAQEMSISLEGKENWEQILTQVTNKLQERLKQNSSTKPADWRVQEEFYSEASALLRNVKNAWRNSIVHARHIYDEGRARAVFDAVRGIMGYLATRLKEDQPPSEEGSE